MITPGVNDPIKALPPTISVPKFVSSNGSVATLMPIELRMDPLGQQLHVVDRLAHFLIREFEDAERADAHHLKAGQDDETDTPAGRLCASVPKRRLNDL